MKYEKKTIFIIVVACILTLLASAGWISSAIYKARYNHSQYELGQLRTELESACNRESELEAELSRASNLIGRIETISGEAVSYIGRTEKILLGTGATIKEIRAQVQDLENYCSNLELYIVTLYNSKHDTSEDIKNASDE